MLEAFVTSGNDSQLCLCGSWAKWPQTNKWKKTECGVIKAGDQVIERWNDWVERGLSSRRRSSALNSARSRTRRSGGEIEKFAKQLK